MANLPERWVVLGRISGVYGVQGWVRVFSHTDPRQGILSYDPWFLGGAEQWEPCHVAEGRTQGKGVVVRLDGVVDREAAAQLMGREIAVPRSQLPQAGPGEYYWTDLQGLEVRTTNDLFLGVVDRLFETGANDVLVVRGERERLIPYLPGQVVQRIDLSSGTITVDWDPDF